MGRVRTARCLCVVNTHKPHCVGETLLIKSQGTSVLSWATGLMYMAIAGGVATVNVRELLNNPQQLWIIFIATVSLSNAVSELQLQKSEGHVPLLASFPLYIV